MATREILQFAGAPGANVLTQVAYAALTAILDDGDPAGILDSNLLNKTLRQSNFMATGLAEFLVQQGIDVPDDGDVPALAANILLAINAIIAASATSGIAVGSVSFFPATAAPTGYLQADGALISRNTYADLWTYAQASGNISATDGAWTAGKFSPGDGATTFRIPDLRGEFLRVWDDGAGIDAGRVIGSNQAQDVQPHTHNATGSPAAAGLTIIGGAQFLQPSGVLATTSAGAVETRPRNIALLACIKY